MKTIKNIKVRLHTRGKDNFSEFPKSLGDALKIIGKNLGDVKNITKLHKLEIYTFNETRDFIEIKYK
tara:strand:+ start:246 stop:446 length:201 start_codon:yes stop_codon:yes gene_type:complete